MWGDTFCINTVIERKKKKEIASTILGYNYVNRCSYYIIILPKGWNQMNRKKTLLGTNEWDNKYSKKI